MPIEEKQAELSDAINYAEEILAALRNAESCETEADFKANIGDARSLIRLLRQELQELRRNISTSTAARRRSASTGPSNVRSVKRILQVSFATAAPKSVSAVTNALNNGGAIRNTLTPAALR